MKSFSSLTRLGQVRRLRALALAALRQYDLKVARLSLLTYHFNAIFRIDTPGKERFVLRINIPRIRTLGNIRSEALWLAALSRDTDLTVPTPVLNRSGERVTTVAASGIPEPRHCVVFEWVPGQDLRHRMTTGNYRKLGALTSRLHDHAEAWNPPPGFDVPTHTGIFIFDTPELFWETTQAPEVITPDRAALFRETARRVQAGLDAIYAKAGKPHILHADLHQGNVRIMRGGDLSVLDFDDCLAGHFVQDIGITFYYMQGHPEYEALRSAYRDGYENRRPWPETGERQIETIIAGRELLLFQFLFFSDNPRYRDAVPRYIARAEARSRGYLDG
ncbi:MAG TPA: phosphotransferase [Anaerolineales bacterium]|nr:phosphotransferase [Anaerolineales bacterium]